MGSTFWTLNGALMIPPTVWRGFRALYGSWKIICALRRTGSSSRDERLVISWPSSSIRPLVGRTSIRTDLAAVVLPDPLSPTSPRVSPGASLRSMPSTAFTWPTVRGMMPRDLTGK